MGYYRRRRYSRQATPLETLAIAAGSLLFICLFTWIFAQPGMWNLGNLLVVAPKSTPTAVPVQVPSDSGMMIGLIGVAGLMAIAIGGGGLLLLGFLWLAQSRTQNKPGAKVVSTSAERSSIKDRTENAPLPGTSQQTSIPVKPELVQLIKTEIRSSPLKQESSAKSESPVYAKAIMTQVERKFFSKLLQVVGAGYYVFPQIPLNQFVSPGQFGRLPLGLYRMQRDGVIDFILANPSNLFAVAAIELDDSSHYQAHVKSRDERKESLLSLAELPLLRFRVGDTWDSQEIHHEIENAMKTNFQTKFMGSRESTLFNVLREASGHYLIFPKIPLRQLIQREDRLPVELFRVLENDTVDFVLADPKYFGALLAINLSSPQSEADGREKLLKQAKIPLLCLQVGDSWRVDDVQQQIQSAIQSNEARK